MNPRPPVTIQMMIYRFADSRMTKNLSEFAEMPRAKHRGQGRWPTFGGEAIVEQLLQISLELLFLVCKSAS